MTFQYPSAPKESISCPLCGGKSFELLASVDRYKMGVQTVACCDCGMITTNPALTVQAIDDFYRIHYREFYSRVSEPSEKYIIRHGGRRRARYTGQFLVRHVRLPANPRILDVGCAEGSVLRELGRLAPGSRGVGVEPGRFAEFAKTYAGCEIVPTVADVPGEAFDLVVVIHVLEHVKEPAAFLGDLKARLAPGGLLYVDVPDAAAYSTIADLHVGHLHHFTSSTLARLAGRAGLRPLLIERHQPPRHPASVRVLLTPSDKQSPPRQVEPIDVEAARRIRMIGSGAVWPTIKGSLPVRAAVGLSRRVADAIATGR